MFVVGSAMAIVFVDAFCSWAEGEGLLLLLLFFLETVPLDDVSEEVGIANGALLESRTKI